MVAAQEALAKSVAGLCLGEPGEFNPWGLFLDGEVLRAVLRELLGLIPPCDLLCPIPTSGLALAGELHALGAAPLMASFYPPDRSPRVDRHLHALMRQFHRPMRVCLVDSVMQEGAGLYVAAAMLESIGAETVAALAVVDNDLIPEAELDPLKKQFLADGRLKCLFRLSALERDPRLPSRS